MNSFVSILVGLLAIGTYGVYKHESRHLKVGSNAATPEQRAHENWTQVSGSYVYFHNALQNDLQRIIISCEDGKPDMKGLERWAYILGIHSRMEDELYVPALKSRLEQTKNANGTLPKQIVSGDDHKSIEELLERALSLKDDTKLLLGVLKELASKLNEHLNLEEKTVMPLLMDQFTTQELGALGSFVINHKLDYCTEEELIDISKWWFSNISIIEIMPILYPLIAVNFHRKKAEPMSLEWWAAFQDMMPALQKYSTEDLVPN